MDADLRLEIFARDISASKAFYEHALGFSGEMLESGYLPMTLGRVTIALADPNSLPTGHHLARAVGPMGLGIEIVIEVDDLEGAYGRATEHVDSLGGKLEPMTVRPWGLRDFRVIDPDGYYIRFTSFAQKA